MEIIKIRALNWLMRQNLSILIRETAKKNFFRGPATKRQSWIRDDRASNKLDPDPIRSDSGETNAIICQ